MPARVKSKRKLTQSEEPGWYRGKQAKTGNSLGLRFDRALFQSHPEFNGEVEARIIAPGRMLVVAKAAARTKPAEDPIVASFLSFLAKDMAASPQRLIPLDKGKMQELDRLVGHIKTDPNEDLGDDGLL